MATQKRNRIDGYNNCEESKKEVKEEIKEIEREQMEEQTAVTSGNDFEPIAVMDGQAGLVTAKMTGRISIRIV